MSNIDEINDSLDELSDTTFENNAEAWRAIALKLESYGIQVPDIDGFEDEMQFKLYLDGEEQPHYLYVNFDTDDDVNESEDKTIVYATFLDPQDEAILGSIE